MVINHDSCWKAFEQHSQPSCTGKRAAQRNSQVFAGQSVHCADPSTEVFPAGHRMQLVAPLPGWYCSLGHFLQVMVPSVSE